ncbi:hypothetical protein [Shewanella algae]|uniref:hypothetical protein n=2 Tax=Shewanella TaxID=22 RepID=UPI0031F47EA1
MTHINKTITIVAGIFLCLLATVANAYTQIPDVKALALDKLVVNRIDQPVTVLQTSPITTGDGKIAKGFTEVTVTVDPAAPMGILINNKQVLPGGSVSVVVDLSSSGGVIKIPVAPDTANLSGKIHYEFAIPKVTAELCDSGFSLNGTNGTCQKVNVSEMIYACPSSWTMTTDLSKCVQQTQIAKVSCPAGYLSNGDGTCTLTETKPTVPKCPTGYAYSATNDRCEQLLSQPAFKTCSDPAYHYDFNSDACVKTVNQPVNYDCASGYSYNSSLKICERTLTASATPVCASGYTYSTTNKRCEKTVTQAASKVCASGYTYSATNNRCEKTTTSSATPVCASGYTYSTTNKRCEKTVTQAASKVCASGYTYSATNNRCEKTTTSSATPVCASGYTYSTTNKRCEKTVTQAASKVCASGYTYSATNNRCEKTTTTSATPVCASGYTYSTTNKRCEKTVTQTASKVCASGYTYSATNNRCEKTTTSSATPVCASGYTYSTTNKRCEKTVTQAASKVCASGYTYSATNNRCEKTTTSSATPVCASGYTYSTTNKRCEKTVTQAASKVCASGYTYSATNNRCEKTTTSSATPVCASGYTYSTTNKRCEKTVTQAASKVCASGYTYSATNNRCEKTTTTSATPVCASGYTYSTTNKRCEKTVTQTASKSCPSGYVDSGTGCQQYTTRPTSCPSGYSSYSSTQCKQTRLEWGSDLTYPGYTVMYDPGEGGFILATASAQYNPNQVCFTTPVPSSTTDTKNCGPMGYYQFEIEWDLPPRPTENGFVTYTRYAEKISGSCPAGTEPYGTSQCKLITELAYSYSCPSGYTLSGTTCSKLQTVANTWSCPTSYTQSGSTCSLLHSQAFTYTCPSGYTLSGSTCSQLQTASNTWSCPTNYTLSGSTCSLLQTQAFTYTCPSGYSLSGSTCSQLQTVSNTWSCPTNYTLSGSTCSLLQTQAFSYTCPSGYTLSGSTCSQLQTVANTWSCPTSYTLSGTTCSLLQTQTFTYTCPSGYTLSGSTCSQLQTVANTWSCPTNYTLSGSKCSLLQTQAFSYTCPSGYLLSGSTCSQLQTASNTWSCPTNYTLSGSTCSLLQTQAFTYTCPSGYSLSGSTCSQLQTAANTWSCPANYTNYNDGTCDWYQTTDYSLSCSDPSYTPSDRTEVCEKELSQVFIYDCSDPAYSVNGSSCELLQTATEDWVCDDPTYGKESETVCAKYTFESLEGQCPSGFVKSANGDTCTFSDTLPKIASCPASYSMVGGECVKTVFDAPTCNAGECTCPSGTTLNAVSYQCEREDKTALVMTCPAGYPELDGVCTYSNTVEVVYDYCPNGMTDLGTDCRLSQYVQLTKSCESPFAVSNNDKCEFIETVPAGFASGTESKLFEGDIVSEISAITFDNKEFDAIVSEVAEIAVDNVGGCRLVDTLSDAEGELSPGNVPCLVQWDSLPEGLTADSTSVSGIFQTAGTHTLAYTLLGYEGAAKSKFEIAKGQIDVNVTMPPKPVVSDVTTRMMGKVLSGTEIYNYDPASRLEFTTVLVEPRNYEQLINISNLGTCNVAAKADSCVIYSNISYERDPENLQTDDNYQIVGNSVIGGWDESELTPTSWVIHHDFRGPNIAFSLFNTDIENAPIENSDLGYTVSVEGQRGAVGISNIRPELSTNDVWWKPSRVDLKFTAKAGSERVNKLDVEGYQVSFNLPILTGNEVKLSNDSVISKEDAGSTYQFALANIVPGDYVVDVIARDAFGNESTTTINDVSFPMPAPQIKVLLRGNSIEGLSSSQSVDMLDDLIIVGHNGIVGDTEIVSVKIDGRDALTANGEGFYKHLTGEGFSLPANQMYSLDVTARDSNGKESTLSLLINYLQMTFGISSKPVTVVSKVEEVALAVNRTRGIRCDLYGTKAAAALASTQYNHACYIEWTELPDGLTPLVTTYQSRLSGAVQSTGTMSATYTAYIVNQDLKTAVIGTETVTFDAVDPIPVKVQMDERTKLADGIYSVSVNDTLIGRYTGESSRAHVDVTLSDDDGNEMLYKHNQLPFADVQTFSAYANKLGAPALWDRIPYKLQAAYRLAPELQSEQNFDLIITPHPYMQVLLDMGEGKYDSTQTINATVKLGMRNSLTGEYEYDSATMGEGWDVFVAFKNGNDYDPISTVAATGSDGQAIVQVDANTIYERNQAVYAVAKAHSPYPEIDVTRVSIPRSVTVVKGTEVEGSLFARVVQSRIPAVFDVRFDTSSINDFLVMGDIRWQFKDANGLWQDNAEYNDKQYITIKSDEPETLGVRAIVTNKSSGAVTTSEALTLISYDVPQVSIVGGNQAIVGQTIELVAQDNSDTPQADTVVEWSNDDGVTWEPGLSSYSLTVGEGTMKVYARMKYANTSDSVTAGQWSQAVKYIAVSKPKPIIMNVSRPGMAEVGTDINLALQISNPFAATGVPVKTEWELPDGTVIADQNELLYSVIQQDLDGSNRISILARSWLDGYKNQSFAEMNILINTFTYQFPAESDMSLTISNNIKFTPSAGYAALSMPYINAPGVTFTYDWTFDADAIEQTLSSGKSMNFLVKQAGVHQIMLTIADNRGNFAHITGFVEAVEPAPMEFKMSNVYSNRYMRAPLNVSLYPSISLSHPYDYIKEYVWTINGDVGEPSTRAIGSFDALPVGHYEVELNVTSNYGQPGKYTTSFDVVANQPPVCEPKARDQYGTYIVDANCTDPDGVISYYRWVINGTEFTPYGAQVRLSATDFPSAQITIEAVDDAGATGGGSINY